MVNGAMVKRNFTTDYIIGRLLMLNPLSEKIAVHLISAEGAPEQETSEYTMLARAYTVYFIKTLYFFRLLNVKFG